LRIKKVVFSENLVGEEIRYLLRIKKDIKIENRSKKVNNFYLFIDEYSTNI